MSDSMEKIMRRGVWSLLEEMCETGLKTDIVVGNVHIDDLVNTDIAKLKEEHGRYCYRYLFDKCGYYGINTILAGMLVDKNEDDELLAERIVEYAKERGKPYPPLTTIGLLMQLKMLNVLETVMTSIDKTWSKFSRIDLFMCMLRFADIIIVEYYGVNCDLRPDKKEYKKIQHELDVHFGTADVDPGDEIMGPTGPVRVGGYTPTPASNITFSTDFSEILHFWETGNIVRTYEDGTRVVLNYNTDTGTDSDDEW